MISKKRRENYSLLDWLVYVMNKYVVDYTKRVVFADIAKPCLCLTERLFLSKKSLSYGKSSKSTKVAARKPQKRSPLSASFPSQQKRPLNYLKKS